MTDVLLSVSKHASERDIRKAYKRLSRKYHPDKNKDPGTENKFVEIAHGSNQSLLVCVQAELTVFSAYEVLSDTTVSRET